jgi:rubrerythrin
MTDDVPYGCLKNGRKQTYREWKQLTAPITTDIPDNIRPPTPPKKNVGMFLEGATNIETKPMLNGNNLSREERLEQIKNKLKKIQDKETQIKQASLDNFKEIEKQFSTPLMDLTNEATMVEELVKELEQKTENEKNKQYLKKTVKRKFTLGKSDKLRRVSILINNRQTRKNILDTQKELKKTTMTDVKQYLRQHGMIKVGSTCPADILRKTFETAVLTGEVTNTNKDTLLHNYMLSDKE